MQQINNEVVLENKLENELPHIVEETIYERPLSYLEWVGSVFLLTIPFVNVVSSIVFILLRGKSKGRSNYVIASLIISFSFLILLAIVLFIFRDYLKDVVQDLWTIMP